MCEKD